MAHDPPELPDGPEDRALQVVATAASGVEADLLCQRLAQAGIPAVSQRSIGGPEWGLSGSRYVYVQAPYVDRAREVLSAPEGARDDGAAKPGDG